MDTAREMIKESLPIKCLEAVIVGLYPYIMFLNGSLNNYLLMSNNYLLMSNLEIIAQWSDSVSVN